MGMISRDAVFLTFVSFVILAAVMLCGPEESVAYVQDARGGGGGGRGLNGGRSVKLKPPCSACYVQPTPTMYAPCWYSHRLISLPLIPPVPVLRFLSVSLSFSPSLDVRYWQTVRCAAIRLFVGFVLSFEGTLPAPLRMLCRLCIEGEEEEEERSRASTTVVCNHVRVRVCVCAFAVHVLCVCCACAVCATHV